MPLDYDGFGSNPTGCWFFHILFCRFREIGHSRGCIHADSPKMEAQLCSLGGNKVTIYRIVQNGLKNNNILNSVTAQWLHQVCDGLSYEHFLTWLFFGLSKVSLVEWKEKKSGNATRIEMSCFFPDLVAKNRWPQKIPEIGEKQTHKNRQKRIWKIILKLTLTKSKLHQSEVKY